MHPETIPYFQYLETIPTSGKHILAQQTDEQIPVYQAFNHAIANYALAHQKFGGSAYSFSRMSWIKPNFLWMMYRCGWADKENQQRVLGIWLKKSDFDHILSESVFTSFQPDHYTDVAEWKAALEKHPVRLQWDPDHDIYGAPQVRKAIQLGIKGKLLEQFAQEMAVKIIDLTTFAQEQKNLILQKNITQLQIPQEWIYEPRDARIRTRIGLTNNEHV